MHRLLLLMLCLHSPGCAPGPASLRRPAPPRAPAFGEPAAVAGAQPGARPSTGGARTAWLHESAAVLHEGGVARAPAELPGEGLADARISPDGRLLAAVTRDGQLVVSSLPWKTPARLGPGLTPSWSPDASELACEREDGIWRIELATSTRTWLGPGQSPAWSPEGSRIAFVHGTPPVLHVMGADGSRRSTLARGQDASSPSWSPDGRWIAVARLAEGRPDDLWAIAADDSRTVRLTWDPLPETDPHWAADGSLWFTRIVDGRPGVYRTFPENRGMFE